MYIFLFTGWLANYQLIIQRQTRSDKKKQFREKFQEKTSDTAAAASQYCSVNIKRSA